MAGRGMRSVTSGRIAVCRPAKGLPDDLMPDRHRCRMGARRPVATHRLEVESGDAPWRQHNRMPHRNRCHMDVLLPAVAHSLKAHSADAVHRADGARRSDHLRDTLPAIRNFSRAGVLLAGVTPRRRAARRTRTCNLMRGFR